MKKITLVAALVFTLSACGRKNDTLKFPSPIVKPDNETSESKNYVYNSVAEPAPSANKSVAFDITKPPSPNNAQIDTAKKITKEGDIHFETGDVAATRKNIIQSVQKNGGYVAEDNELKNDSGVMEYTLKVRIPSKNFDRLLDTVSNKADHVDSKNISIKDVTTEYIDIKSRLDNKQKLEIRYLALLNKAARMEDILQIEGKLTEIRSDIESTQAQLNYLNKQVAYSSLDITFYSKSVVPANDSNFGYKLKSAISGGWDFLQSLFFGLIQAWPMLLICMVIYLLLRHYIRKRRERKNLAVG